MLFTERILAFFAFSDNIQYDRRMSLLLKIIFWYCVFLFVRSLLRGRVQFKAYVNRANGAYGQRPSYEPPRPSGPARARVQDEAVIEADYRVIKDS